MQDVENKCVPKKPINRLTKEGGIRTEKKENILLGKASSSDYSEGLYLPNKANDGDFVTRWSGLGDGSSGFRYWQADLGELYRLEKLNIYFESVSCGYKIQTKRKETDSWTDASYVEYPEELSFEETYDKIECRYIRIAFFYEGGNLSMFEVQAFGEKVAAEGVPAAAAKEARVRASSRLWVSRRRVYWEKREENETIRGRNTSLDDH